MRLGRWGSVVMKFINEATVRLEKYDQQLRGKTGRTARWARSKSWFPQKSLIFVGTVAAAESSYKFDKWDEIM